MRLVRTALLAFVALTAAGAQTPDLLLSDRRLTVHTLVREDIFAGLLDDRMDRMSRAERNIEALLKERPEERGNLLAWRGATALYHAVVAHESGRPDEFERHFARAREDFANAAAAQSGNDGVAATTGGSLAVLGDRLPQQHRAAAWSQAYDAYALLWKQQGAAIEKLPVHLKGEVLAGLTQSAQRTGRTEEAAQYLDTMLGVLVNTRYEPLARQWKADPAIAATTNLTCKDCHGPGRLSRRLAALKD